MNDDAWFTAKSHGWGLTPISWQGWVIVGMVVLGLQRLMNMFSSQCDVEDQDEAVVDVVAKGVIGISAVYVILKALEGLSNEPLGWRWGYKKETVLEVGE